ncbi:MAG: 50S ribosomal protein L19e [Nanoarchaeota archaeon]
MKLEKKKALASRTLGIGKGRIMFNSERLSEIKEAITKQDIKDLRESGAIIIKEKKGRKKIINTRKRRRFGSVKKKPKKSKANYIILTRKLRSYLKHLRTQNKVSEEQYKTFRKEIRSKIFKNLSHMKEKITGAE